MELKGIELDVIITPEGKGRYSISSVQIPNVVTQGKSIEEAKRRLKEALNLYLEDMPLEKKSLMKKSEEDRTPLITRIFL